MPRLPHEEVTNSPETLIKKVHSVGSMWASTPTRIIETLVQIKYYVNHFEKRIFMDYTAAVITVSRSLAVRESALTRAVPPSAR